ncbi:MAG: NADH:flavin oxidoreductase [Candidatus Tectomicrobia bacterium]|nr:NADH:flavin oxidoreductase [Candidatus Tectomicrobia bacterium]
MKLMEPLRINSTTIHCRVLVPAMVTRLSGEDGYVNQAIRDRYVRYAMGEVGLLVVEAMAIHGNKSGPLLRISEDRFIPGLRDMVREVHEASDTKIVPQIIHFLKISRRGWRQKVEDLSREEIKLIVEQFGNAAYRARQAEFDGVELHMAHAYTMSSFLSMRNKRKDEYGGKTLEDRMRAMGEVITRVRQAVGDDFAVGVRFDAEEGIKKGYTLNDSREFALRMAQLGADYISLSAGGKFEDAIIRPGHIVYPYTGYSGDKCMPGDYYPDGTNLYLAEGIKRYLVERGYQTPLVCAGKISHAEHAEEILQKGWADIIGMARANLADADWAKKVREGREKEIIRCIYCNVCKNLDETHNEVICYLWPKGTLHAPLWKPGGNPVWPTDGKLTAAVTPSEIKLSWEEASHADGVCGYDLFRREGDGQYEWFTATTRTNYRDQLAIAGRAYKYYVQAYTEAGMRSTPTEVVEATIPFPDYATASA